MEEGSKNIYRISSIFTYGLVSNVETILRALLTTIKHFHMGKKNKGI
jgi:hypothetical protein